MDSGQSDKDQEIKELRHQVEGLQEQIGELTNIVSDLKARVEQIERSPGGWPRVRVETESYLDDDDEA